MIEAGEQAPDFTLSDQDGNDVSLSDYAGRTVVLYFYPKADTPGCTTQACGIRDHRADYEAAGAVARASSSITVVAMVVASLVSVAPAGAYIVQERAGLAGTTVACICGTDRDYGSDAAELAAELRAAGATQVWLAGPPSLAVDGVDGHLHAGCDALAVLHTVTEHLLEERA